MEKEKRWSKEKKVVKTGSRGAGAGDADGRAVGGVEAHVAQAVPGVNSV